MGIAQQDPSHRPLKFVPVDYLFDIDREGQIILSGLWGAYAVVIDLRTPRDEA